MKSKKLHQFLESIHPLSQDFKLALDRELEKISYPTGHFLLNFQMNAGYIFFLEKGFVVSFQYHQHKKTILSLWGAGQLIISPKSFFEQSRAQELIQLTTDSDLWGLSVGSFNRLCDRFPVMNFIVRVVTARYHARSEQRILDLHHLTAWERYNKLLTEHAGIEQVVSQDLIASYLNITPQSLSRLRHNRN